MAEISFNSPSIPLIEPGNSASVLDQNFDGSSDKFSIAFEGADGRRYELIGEADPQKRQWGEGSTYEVYDTTGVDHVLLARYEISAEGYPTPVHAAGDGKCVGIGTNLVPTVFGPPTVELPDGSLLRIQTPLDRTDSSKPATHVELLTADGEPWLDFKSEGYMPDGGGRSDATLTEIGYDSRGLSNTDKTQPHLTREEYSWR